MAKYNNRFIAFDTETGGIPNKGECKGKQATIDVSLTEVAFCIIDSEQLEIVKEYSWLIKPYTDDLIYTLGAEKISGISKQLCEEKGLDLEIVYKNIVDVFKDNKVGSKKPIIIIQNASFDVPFMENLFLIFEDKFHAHIDSVEDTMVWSRRKWPELGKHSLGAISERCGLDHTQAHRALPDTRITAEIWIHFMKLLRGSIVSNNQEEQKFRKGFKF